MGDAGVLEYQTFRKAERLFPHWLVKNGPSCINGHINLTFSFRQSYNKSVGVNFNLTLSNRLFL